MLGHACPNELIACARARDAQRGKEKAVIDRDCEWEWVSEAERYKTPNTFSIMSPTRLAGHGSDSTLRQHSNQITRQTELFNCCKCVTLLLPPFECPLLVPPLPAPWQSLARQIWSHLPFAPGQIVLLHLRNLLIRTLCCKRAAKRRNFDNQPNPLQVLYWISLNSIYIVCIYFCALKCALNCGAC